MKALLARRFCKTIRLINTQLKLMGLPKLMGRNEKRKK
jgi:hypothetical protein